MAITQQQYGDAIGRAGLVFSDGVTDACNAEKAGCTYDWSELFFWYQQIKVAQYLYANQQYNTDDGLYFYDKMLCIAGLNYITAQIDPNAQVRGIVVDVTTVNTTSYVYTQANLIDSDPPNGNYYLPFINPLTSTSLAGKTPILVTVNGVQIPTQLDDTFNPPRLYGFSNNATQTIIVTVI